MLGNRVWATFTVYLGLGLGQPETALNIITPNKHAELVIASPTSSSRCPAIHQADENSQSVEQINTTHTSKETTSMINFLS